MTITFARTRHVYDSYNDLWTLVGLSDFPTCYVDEIDADDPARCYILPTRNGEWGEGWQGARARLIHWNFEWDAYPETPGVGETWHSDAWFARQIGARHVPLGSHRDLRLQADSVSSEHFDVAYLGYMIPRREQMRHDLRQLGVTVSTNGAWGEARHKLLSNSSVYFHAHQHEDKPGVPPLRMVVAAAYAMPFVTENVADAGVFAEHIMQAPYSHLAGFTRDWLRDLPMLREHGAVLYQMLCEDMPFRKSVEGVL